MVISKKKIQKKPRPVSTGSGSRPTSDCWSPPTIGRGCPPGDRWSGRGRRPTTAGRQPCQHGSPIIAHVVNSSSLAPAHAHPA
jgi:hypothetical protein